VSYLQDHKTSFLHAKTPFKTTENEDSSGEIYLHLVFATATFYQKLLGNLAMADCKMIT
jgi:hypothetical protein